MNSKPDPRVRFEPDPADTARRSPLPHRDSWFPALTVPAPDVAPARWMTRSSRGLSWNRTGLIVCRDLRR